MKKIIQAELEEGSFFAYDYLKSLLEHDDRTLPPVAKTSKGVRFIVLASFHDAKIMDICIDTMWGKNCVTILVDFRNTSTEFKAGYNKFYIRFVGVKNATIPDKVKDLYILSSDFLQQNTKLQVDFELEYFIKNAAYHDMWQIDFVDVVVSPLNKVKF